MNDLLLHGSDFTNNIVSVLLKFRQQPVAVMGDVEKMFHQVLVAPDDRDCLRYYWWLNGKSCANFALRQSIEDNRSKFDPNLCQAALQNFYVDDFLCAVADENKAIQMINGIHEICHLEDSQ